MTTRPYEMMDQSPHELEQVIRQFPDTVKSLADDVLTAMLAWSQANQDATVHQPCWEESFRRGDSNHATLDEHMNDVRHAEGALKDRMALWRLGSDAGMTADNPDDVTPATVITGPWNTQQTAEPAPAVADHMQAKQTVYSGSGPTSTTVSVDLCDLVIELELEKVFGDPSRYHLDVPTAYRLGAGLIKSAEDLATYCAWESRGEEKDSRYSLPDDADFGCTHGAIWKRDCADCSR